MPGLRKLPSGKWQATVRLPNGKRATKTDASKPWVRQWGEALEADIRRGLWQDPTTITEAPTDEPQTLGQWREEWMESRHREFNTARREDHDWKMRVGPTWEHRQLDTITRLEVQTWPAAMARQGVGPISHKQALEHLRQLCAAAVAHGRMATDITQGVKKPAIPKHPDRILSRTEWQALDMATGADPMVRAMLWCGLRWGEAAGLHRERIDLDRSLLHVTHVLLINGEIKKYPKSRAGNRTVPLSLDLEASLRAIRKRSGLMFRRPLQGRRSTKDHSDYRNWLRSWHYWLRTAGLDDPQPTPHDLRHTYGSWLADDGMTIHDIAALMGHSNLRSTERYVHSSSSRMDRARRALDQEK